MLLYFNSLTALRAKLKSATSENETSREVFSTSFELAMSSCIASSEITPCVGIQLDDFFVNQSGHDWIVNAGFLRQKLLELALVFLQKTISP